MVWKKLKNEERDDLGIELPDETEAEVKEKTRGNKVVKVIDSNTNQELSYSMDIRLLRNLENKIIPSLHKKDKDAILVIDGKEGCLTGDTLIQLSRGKVSRKYTLKRLYNHYNDNPDEIIQKDKNFNKKIPSFVRSFNGKDIRLHKLKDVFYSGKKQVFLLELENGKTIKATSNHKFLTKDGWKPLSKLKKTDEIMCDKLKAEKNGRKKIKLYDIQLKVPYHPFGSPTNRVEVHKLVYEARLNKLPFISFLDILLNDPKKSKTLKYIDSNKYHIHHIDGCHYNNSIENLKLINKEEHLKYHSNNVYQNFSQGIPTFSVIKSVTKLGIEDTYDIECEEPHHNFVANGIVVHNSGKSTFAIQVGKFVDPSLDLSRIVFTPDDFRAAILKAKKGQCIIYDEAFTGFSSRASLSPVNKVLVSLAMQMRQKNLFILIVLPTIFLLDRYMAIYRTKALFHVYESRGRRGYFKVFNAPKKKYLILMGKKTMSYKVKGLYTNFQGRFYGKFVLGGGDEQEIEEKYRKKKEEALAESELSSMSSAQVKYKDQRDLMIYLFKKYVGLNLQEIEPILFDYDFIISYQQIAKICAKFGSFEKEKKEKEPKKGKEEEKKQEKDKKEEENP